MKDTLAQTYRDSQRQLFSENERLHWEIEQLKEQAQDNANLRAEYEIVLGKFQYEAAENGQLHTRIDALETRLRYALAALKMSTDLMDELLYDQMVVLGDEYTKKVIYQVAKNEAAFALETDIGEK